jgi:hypothetical protein
MTTQHDDIEDGLTPEERAALEINEDDLPEELADDDKDNSDADDKDDAGDAAGDAAAAGDANADAGAADDAAADPAGAEPPAAAEPAAAPPVAPAAPVLIAQAPEDADAKLAEIASSKESIIAKFDDGEITAKEMQLELDKLNKAERDIERQVDRAQLAAQMEEQRRMNEWVAQANAFAKEHGYADNQRKYFMLDQEVRAIAATAEGAKLTGGQILEQAHKNLVEAGIATAKAAATPAPKPAAKAKPAVELPPSTHRLPAADVDDVSGGEFAELNRLAISNPLAFEQKLAAMSDADRERYLAAA